MSNIDEQSALLLRAKNNDEFAKEKLIVDNSPLIKSVIKRYLNKGVEYNDLYQLGCLGFVKAISNFDSSFNVKFSTYAVPMIAGEIKRYLRDNGIIKVSRNTKMQNIQIQKYIQRVWVSGRRNSKTDRIQRSIARDSVTKRETGGNKR